LEKDNKADPELAYWNIKYILLRGDKPFSGMGDMTKSMRTLAQSQEKNG
jgi:hypothetical protein